MSETIHAGCVAIGDRGVLICGPSGSGKSDLAIRLIDRGARLVSDDYTIVRADSGRVVAAVPDTIAGKIELRGVGIVELSYLEQVPLALVVDLAMPPQRLPEPATRLIAGKTVPLIAIAGLEPSAPMKVEWALALHGLTLTCRT